MAVQRLRLYFSTAVGTGLIPRELRSHMLCCVAKKKKSKTILAPEVLKKVGGKGDGVRRLAQWQSCPSVYLKKHQIGWDQGPENR